MSSSRDRWASVRTGWRYFVTKTKWACSRKAVSTSANVACLSHGPNMLCGMQLRYRYRLDQPRRSVRRSPAPSGAPGWSTTTGSGCVRTRTGPGCRLSGGWSCPDRSSRSPSRPPNERGSGEVSAVALQQSLADLDRAYRNYFRNLKRVKAARARGDKAKLRVRKPRFKSRHHEQAVRFTLNSRFRVLPDGRLSLPKVGRLKVRWSRSLPSAPSSVTITLDRAGRYHASFVVEAVEAPLAPAETAVGIDLGLTSFATLSDGRRV